MMKRIGQLLYLPVLFLICFFLLAGAFGNLQALKKTYPAIGLRYEQRISQTQAQEARKYAIKQADSKEYWPTFWAADDFAVTVGDDETTVPGIVYDGTPELVWPADVKQGNLPGMADRDGCAVSEQLAWQLWGSTDVVGMTLKVAGRQAIVRGVLKGEKPLLLLGVGEGGYYEKGWQNVELAGALSDNPTTEAENFGKASGLGQPKSIVNGGLLQGFATAIVLAPVTLAVLWALVRLYKGTPISKRRLFKFVLLAGTILFAVCLPLLLGLLPGWLIPSKWSDFSFWHELFNRLGGWIYDWFMLVPFAKDADAKVLLVWIVGQSVLCLPLLFALGGRLLYGRPQPGKSTQDVVLLREEIVLPVPEESTTMQ